MKRDQEVINEMWAAERERRRWQAERIVESGTKEEIDALFKTLRDAVLHSIETVETA